MDNKKSGKALAFLGLIIFLYLFIFSLVLIKHSFSELAKEALRFTRDNTNPINSFGFGWLLTLVMQSSGAATSALVALNASGIIGASLLIFMVLGTRIGTTITALLVALFIHAKKRDFRHGFEIGLANLIYAFPVAIIMFVLEYFFRFFSYAGNFFISLGIPFRINFVDTITIPVINLISFLPKSLLVIAGAFLLAISLKSLPRFIFSLWGGDYLKKKINKYMKNRWRAFLVGFLVTALLLSTSITITLLIPIIVIRIINLKKAILYI